MLICLACYLEFRLKGMKTKKSFKNKEGWETILCGPCLMTAVSTEELNYDYKGSKFDSVANVTANRLKSQNGTLFSHVWRRGRLALDPLQNKSCSEFFSQAHKNWHITWGNNLGPDWPPLAKGFQISHYHTPTRPLNFFPLDNRRIQAYRS